MSLIPEERSRDTLPRAALPGEMCMMFQTIIDDIGKLGPLCVAIAVYLATNRINDWNIAVAKRSAEIEDQKLRLALLDRRQGAIEALGEAGRSLFTAGASESSEAMIGRLREALGAAELIFERREAAAIHNVLHLVLQMIYHDAQRESSDENERQYARQKWEEAFLAVLKAMDPLPGRLQAATRITPVPPLQDASRRDGFTRILSRFVKKR